MDFHIIGAGRGGTSLITGLIDAHPDCQVHFEEFSTKFLMGREWTDAENEVDPNIRASKRIQNFISACERKKREFPELKWGHKTTTEHVMGLSNGKNGFHGFHDDSSMMLSSSVDSSLLALFIQYTSHLKTIFILRDGRTCIPSKMKRAGLPLQEAILRWKYSVCVLSAMHDGLSENLLVLKFEELLKKPEEHLRQVCDFLEVSFSPKMMLGTNSSKIPQEYRRDGFDVSVTNISECDEEWINQIKEELIYCGYY